MKLKLFAILFFLTLQIQVIAQVKTTYFPGGSQKSSEGMLLNAPAQVFTPAFDQLPKQQQDQLMASASRHGIWKYWYQSGTLQSEQEYANGSYAGHWTAYHPDGVLAYEIDFSAGTARYYHPNGQLMNSGQITQDFKRTGLWKSFDEQGHLVSEGNYTANQKDGVWKWYTANGAVDAEEVFQTGNRISYKKF